MKTKNPRPVSVREKILKCAVKLLNDGGIRKLTQPQIAKAAGVPQGHMTYYFPTRADLLLAVAERSLNSIAELVINGSKKSSLDLNNSISLALPLIKDKSRTRMLIGLLVESDENPAIKEKLREQVDRSKFLIGMLAGHEAESPEVEIINAAILGLGIQHYINKETNGKSSEAQADDHRIEKALHTLATKMKGV